MQGTSFGLNQTLIPKTANIPQQDLAFKGQGNVIGLDGKPIINNSSNVGLNATRPQGLSFNSTFNNGKPLGTNTGIGGVQIQNSNYSPMSAVAGTQQPQIGSVAGSLTSDEEEGFELVKDKGKFNPLNTISKLAPIGLNLYDMFANKPTEFTQQRIDNYVRPASGINYEQMANMERNLAQGLGQGMRTNNTTDALSNASKNQSMISKITEQRNKLQGDNSALISESLDKQYQGMSDNKQDEVKFKNELARGQAQAKDAEKLRKTQKMKDLLGNVQDINDERNTKKQFDKNVQTQLEQEQSRMKYAGMDKAASQQYQAAYNAKSRATQELAMLQAKKQANPTDTTIDSLITQKQSELQGYENDIQNATQTTINLNSNAQKDVLNSKLNYYGYSLKRNTGGLLYKKGGLTFDEKASLENQKQSHKLQIETIRQKAKSIEKDLRQLSKTKDSDKNFRDGIRLIMDFHKSLKK